MKSKTLKYWPLLLIFTISILLRLIKLEDLFYFTYDESIPAFVGRRIILWHHIPLIGGVTPFGFHLGPYFYWFYSLLLYIGNLNPAIWGWSSAVLAGLTTLLMYATGKEFGNKKIGFTAAIFWAFSSLANIYDRHLWALSWGPPTALLVILSLNKLVKGEKKYVFLLAFTLAIAIHADPSNLIFLAVAVPAFFLFRIPFKKALVVFSIFFISSITPLIIFDLRHNFSNTSPILNFIKAGKNKPALDITKFSENALLFPRAFSRLVYTFGDTEISKQYSYCPNFVKEKFSQIPLLFLVLSSVFLVSFVYLSFARNQNAGWKIMALTLIVYFIGIQLYGTFLQADIFEHYLTGLFPMFLLVLAKLVGSFPKKLWLIVIAFFVFLNLTKLFSLVNNMSLADKKNAVVYTITQIGDKPFSLDSLSTCWKYNGYRYLFAVFGREPVKSYVDPNFAYLYGTTPVWKNHPDTVAAFVVHDYQPESEDYFKRYSLLKLHQISSSTFGIIEAIIMDNSTSWFDQPQTLKDNWSSVGFEQ